MDMYPTRYAQSFPVPAGEPVTEGHVAYCARDGHAKYSIDGVDQGVCPRCGAMTPREVRITEVESGQRFEWNGVVFVMVSKRKAVGRYDGTFNIVVMREADKREHKFFHESDDFVRVFHDDALFVQETHTDYVRDVADIDTRVTVVTAPDGTQTFIVYAYNGHYSRQSGHGWERVSTIVIDDARQYVSGGMYVYERACGCVFERKTQHRAWQTLKTCAPHSGTPCGACNGTGYRLDRLSFDCADSTACDTQRLACAAHACYACDGSGRM